MCSYTWYQLTFLEANTKFQQRQEQYSCVWQKIVTKLEKLKKFKIVYCHTNTFSWIKMFIFWFNFHRSVSCWLKWHYHQTSNISHILLGNKIVDYSDLVWAPLCQRCSSYIFIFDTWLQWIGQKQLHEDRRNIWVFRFGVPCIRCLMVSHYWFR